MKKNFKVICGLIIVFLLFLTCSNFLDETPQGVQTSDTFLKTQNDIVRALTAAYDPLGWFNSQETEEWWLGDICSDDAEKGGESASDIPEILELKSFKGNASISFLESRYSEPYQGIFRSNLVIDNTPNIKMDDTVQQQEYIGEAKFLRAYYYFMLVKTFGGVPLVTHVLTPDHYCQPRASIDSCWMQIENDLTDAAAVIPLKSAVADAGRATKGAAQSLLVKTYIFEQKFVLAQKVAEEVINSGEYDLQSNYADIFTIENQNGIESIFEVQHTFIPTNGYGDANEGQVTSKFQGGRNYPWFGGYGFDCPTQDFVNEFEPNDPRLRATVIFDGDMLYAGTPVQFIADNSDSPTKMHAKKYLLEFQGDPDNVPNDDNAPANWRVIRYADLLLFHAEAANENGNAAAALISLNKVRSRVGLPSRTTTNKDSLRTYIYHERRVELGFEGQRFFDLVRQGRAAEVLGRNGFIKGRHEYFPIPQNEIDICNKMTPNPY